MTTPVAVSKTRAVLAGLLATATVGVGAIAAMLATSRATSSATSSTAARTAPVNYGEYGDDDDEDSYTGSRHRGQPNVGDFTPTTPPAATSGTGQTTTTGS